MIYFLGLILQFFDADPGSGMEKRDPGWKKVGSDINIPDPQHCATPNNCKASVSGVCEDSAPLCGVPGAGVPAL
jgi:hypothetical protein